MQRRLSLAVASLTALAPGGVQATNGYQLIGIGAYQKSVGGAVTANPGSAMTAVTNPAGLARIGSRADFSMEAFMPDRSVDFTAMGGGRNESGVGLYGVPAIGWSAPTREGSPVFFGGGMYGTSGMGVDYASRAMGSDTYWDGYSNITFWQMAPSIAWRVNDRLALGASLNIDYQSAAFSQRGLIDTDKDGQGDTVAFNFDLGREASSFGAGFTVGLLYDLGPRATLGLAYKSKQYFEPLEYRLANGDIDHPRVGALPAGTYTLDLDYPQQIALGLALRPSARLTVAVDVKWIEWSDTMGSLAVRGPGGASFPLDPGWSDQTVYALGLDYAVTDRLNLRAGFNYGEMPFRSEEVSRNFLLPAVVEQHYTLGFGYRINGHWAIGGHVMYAPEETLTAPADDPNAPGARISLAERSAGFNIGYRF